MLRCFWQLKYNVIPPIFDVVLFEGNPLCFKALVGEVQARACARVGVDTQEFVIGKHSCHFKLKTSNAVVNIDVYNCDSVHTLSQLPKTPAQPPARCLLFVDPFAHHVRMDDLAWFGKNSTHSAIIMYAAVQSAVRMAGSARSSSTSAETARGLEEQLRLYIGDNWQAIQTKQDSGGAHHGNNPRANTALICNELSRRLKCAATADTNTTSIRMAQQGATYGLVLATSSGKAFNNWKAVCRKDKRVQVISTPTGDMFEFQKDVVARHQSGSVNKAAVRFLHKAAKAAKGEWVQPGGLAKQILAHPVLVIKDVDNVLARVRSHAEGKLLRAPLFVHDSVKEAPTANKSRFRFFARTWSEVGDLGVGWLAYHGCTCPLWCTPGLIAGHAERRKFLKNCLNEVRSLLERLPYESCTTLQAALASLTTPAPNTQLKVRVAFTHCGHAIGSYLCWRKAQDDIHQVLAEIREKAGEAHVLCKDIDTVKTHLRNDETVPDDLPDRHAKAAADLRKLLDDPRTQDTALLAALPAWRDDPTSQQGEDTAKAKQAVKSAQAHYDAVTVELRSAHALLGEGTAKLRAIDDARKDEQAKKAEKAKKVKKAMEEAKKAREKASQDRQAAAMRNFVTPVRRAAPRTGSVAHAPVRQKRVRKVTPPTPRSRKKARTGPMDSYIRRGAASVGK